MRILGIDPGTWNTGVGIIDSEGNRAKLLHFQVISFPKGSELSTRLLGIYTGLCGIIRDYAPEVMALENIFYCKDLRAMIRIGEARACAMLAASEKNVPVVEYPPARIKQATTGSGKATKEQVQHMIQRLLSMKELPPPDGADALAVALCHMHSRKSVKEKLLEGLSENGRKAVNKKNAALLALVRR
ncbi:MAG TPA: crossover junction endodeoxyribonuclease RuvC [Verrucomicrobiae bacterium]|nr:crossover junction endodeoxyribonuclease RuvC [Verrucomicrobiae bacterium]